jgi:hypothetical protein
MGAFALAAVAGFLTASYALPSTPTAATQHVTPAQCLLPRQRGIETNVSAAGESTFIQPIDHRTPELGSFHQRYYWNHTFWQPGSPIVVFLPGEQSAEHYIVYSQPEFSTVGVIAENLGAAVIVPEHRYYGSSSPFSELTTANLTYLTVENALMDVVNLAQHIVLPWANTSASTASDVPWILVGITYFNAAPITLY